MSLSTEAGRLTPSCSSDIPIDIYAQMAPRMLKQGHDRDEEQCCMKVKELRQTYQEVRESAQEICG